MSFIRPFSRALDDFEIDPWAEHDRIIREAVARADAHHEAASAAFAAMQVPDHSSHGEQNDA
jgi:hypothetical protein